MNTVLEVRHIRCPQQVLDKNLAKNLNMLRRAKKKLVKKCCFKVLICSSDLPSI